MVMTKNKNKITTNAFKAVGGKGTLSIIPESVSSRLEARL